MAENIFGEFGIDIEELRAIDEAESRAEVLETDTFSTVDEFARTEPVANFDTPVTPEAIESKEFSVSLRGFDQEEVRNYMRKTAAAYRTAVQDSQLASLELENARHSSVEVEDAMRHAAAQMEDAKAIREESARELEEAGRMRLEALRAQEEAEVALQAMKEKQAEMDAAAPSDPYQHASVQIASVLRSADEAASLTRRDAENDASAIRLEAEEALRAANVMKVEIERQIRRRAEEHMAKVAAAANRVNQVMTAMESLESQIKLAVATAMEELSLSNEIGDLAPLDPAE